MSSMRQLIIRSLPIFALFSLLPAAHGQWTVPTEEELKMTSQPEVPGAAAVYLFREEITDDKLHNWSKYVRLKVLTDRGKDYANVELRQFQADDRGGYTVSDIQGRTIHPDGTIIPFTGKPFEKLIEKSQGFKEMAKVFTLPDVQVGSIIEYRYKLRYDDDRYIAPDWYIQSDLYTRKAHYLWKPTDQQLITRDEKGEQLTSVVAWTPILPKGVEVKQSRQAATTSFSDGQAFLEVNIHDVAPVPDEEYMPPIQSLSYRVLFYYSPYRSVEEYWKNQGKGWSKSRDKFIGPDSKLKEAVNTLISPSDTDEQKLHKIYSAIMKLDNTTYSRDRSEAEEKAQGLSAPKSTADIWERKRGSDDQITELFVALARAAGMKAYLAAVTARNRSIFLSNYLSFSQLDDYLAIVNVGGKEQVFDPGSRYCPYGQLAWKHSMTSGIRQVDGGTSFTDTPTGVYSASRTQRIADLTMDEHGAATGIIKLSWTGSPALRWRQSFLSGDNTSFRRDLKTSLEHMLPEGMDVNMASIENLEEYEQPLTVSFDVKGQIASSTGKRLLIPASIFEMNSKPSFPHDKRTIPVYFSYPHAVQDVMRIKFPASLGIESIPTTEQVPFQTFAAYQLKSESTPTSVTMRREFDLGTILYKTEEYPELRSFYSKFETKDQEPVVLKVVTQTATVQ